MQPSESTQASVQRIQTVIRQRGVELRQQYPILRHQNAIGLSIFLLAGGSVIAVGWAYYQGLISALWCIPLVAFFTSFLHELEHDLIHWQYFKKKRPVHHAMLLGCWILRPGTINPWVRRHLHFLHHKVSGTSQDLEERGIGNGLTYGPLRLFIMSDTLGGNLLRAFRERPPGKRLKAALRILAVNFPFAIVTALTWYAFWLFHITDSIAGALGITPAWSPVLLDAIGIIDFWVVVLIAPFYLRSFCLNFISSTMHYYGNVGSLLQQTQVLNVWYLWPFQLFCCNFGSTHGIHHFVVGEPFYIRQMTARVAHEVMREEGVRFNDLQTFRRANRFPGETASDLEAVPNV